MLILIYVSCDYLQNRDEEACHQDMEEEEEEEEEEEGDDLEEEYYDARVSFIVIVCYIIYLLELLLWIWDWCHLM